MKKPVLTKRAREERLLRFQEEFANRLETHSINLFSEMRCLIRELGRLVGEQQEENTKMREFYVAALFAHDKLLNITSKQLLEKEIHKLIEQEEDRQECTKEYAKKHGWGGISKEILNCG